MVDGGWRKEKSETGTQAVEDKKGKARCERKRQQQKMAPRGSGARIATKMQALLATERLPHLLHSLPLATCHTAHSALNQHFTLMNDDQCPGAVDVLAVPHSAACNKQRQRQRKQLNKQQLDTAKNNGHKTSICTHIFNAFIS